MEGGNKIHTFAATVKTRVGIINISPLSLEADSDGYANLFSFYSLASFLSSVTYVKISLARMKASNTLSARKYV